MESVLNLVCQPLSISRSGVEMLLRDYRNQFYSDELNTRVKMVLFDRLQYYQGKAFVYV